MLKEILEKSNEVKDKKAYEKIYKDIIEYMEEVIAYREKMKSRGDKLDELYKEQTGKSILFQSLYNGSVITKDDIDNLKKLSKKRLS